MKKILTFGLLIALLAGIYGYFQWNKPHKDTSKISADVVLDANDLLHAFESDESKANTQYLDKV
ncbi:MAG TPA: hypothetical protein ENK85_07865, partial [Saprospiraceae bacterium]|nr:hypothetical protein [Saprospiraceae bacterium]